MIGKSKFSIKRIRKIKIEDLIILIYLCAFFLRFFVDAATSVTGIFFMLSGLLCASYVFIKYAKYRKVMIPILLIAGIGILNAVLSKNGSVPDVIYLFTAQTFGFYIYKKCNNLKFIRLFFLFLFWYISFKVVFMPTFYNGDIGISRLCGKNSISIMMMFAYCIDLIDREEKNKSPNYLYPIIGTIISYLTDSSGGILAFIILGIGVFSLKNAKKIAWTRILIFGSIGVALVVLGGYYTKIFEFLSDDNSRFWIWSQYFNCASKSISDVLFGGDISSVPFLVKQQNMHNTFINWHFRAGLLPCLAYLGTLIYVGIECFKRKQWFYFLIWLATTIRSVTDGTDYCFMSLWVFLYLKITLERNGIKSNIIGTTARRTVPIIK